MRDFWFQLVAWAISEGKFAPPKSPLGSVLLKRPPIAMATLFWNLVLVLSFTLVVASCGEARMADRSSISGTTLAKQMREASYRRHLATTNATTLNATTSLSEDADVLLLLKASLTSDPLNVTRYWKPIGRRQVVNPCRPWVGITCTKRRVTAINLSNRSLTGTLPADIARLSRLTTLNLSSNFFSGSIFFPPSLQTLDLGNNNLNGSFLSSQIISFPNLTSLVLSANDLTGAIPAWVTTNLTSLRTLNVSRNRFSGPVPAGAWSPALEVLDLSHNNLSGAIPDLGRLPNLTVLDVGGNNFQGGIPSSIGNCTVLVTLDLSRNPSLGGGIPGEIGKLIRLTRVEMAGSNLSETIPTEMNGISGLTEMDLSDNSLSGEVPLENFGNLTKLWLQNNRLEGAFLSRVPSMPRLDSLDVRNNALTGSIPEEIGNVQFKAGILIGGNRMNGSVPEGLGQLTLVNRIDLSANRFSGSIPAAFQNCLSLTELNISYNSLNGSLPSLSHLTSLTFLDASFNSFSGQIAPTFVNFTSLKFLNVSSNQLSGELPSFAAHDNVTAQSFLNNSGLCGSLLGKSCGSRGNLATSTIVYIAIGSAAGLILLLVFAALLFSTRKSWTRKGSRHPAQVSDELQMKVSPDEILAATDQFNETGYIGGGKLSTVYRGKLPDNTAVAVKRLAIMTPEPRNEAAAKALDMKLETLGHIRHQNLVKVLGYCSNGETKALVLEYMPNGSLDALLHPPGGGEVEEVNRAFDWSVRFKIAVEVAQGLKYLHADGRRQPVVHGDVKPSNILFDEKMEAKVADYGVARVLKEQGFAPVTSAATSVAIAHGYTAPEEASSGIPSLKGDVYGFGILLLQMITGRSPYTLEPGQTLPQWVRATMSSGMALPQVLDPQLLPELPAYQQTMAMVLGLALLCTRHQPQERPHMDDVLKMLAHIQSRPEEKRRTTTTASSSSSRSDSNISSSIRPRKRASSLMLMSTTRKPIGGSLRTSTSWSSVSGGEVLQPSGSEPQQGTQLPHTPSLSDWTPPSEV